ncbi:hypothetical protein BAUCODRAFT_121740 [Baudoinia panamericana UAMH 10762]|uniref:Uncharacterized protein n=1 Tax=Baudoinia panamericana (strain UAMH 10762) TaxID=717646 RepID=M2NDE4_BAUPA|nr:uncharacterized protein BAUCODRAFT_121740 [Baudoinia panamericana UAMH 10762]EMC97244.1 hypothetical protein BAUCODRAFT_121740 [Baudoinia panamericana UAMH 10762]
MCKSYEKALNTLMTMIERGRKYKFLEQELGLGVCICLGTDLSESHWDKLLKKTTADFSRIMEHLREKGVSDMANRLGPLRDFVVSQKIRSFTTDPTFVAEPVTLTISENRSCRATPSDLQHHGADATSPAALETDNRLDDVDWAHLTNL